MSERKCLIGLKFGRLTVISFSHIREKDKMAFWNCDCSCGGHKTVGHRELTRSKTKSCGCWYKQSRHLVNLSHGRAGENSISKSTYRSWKNMKQRCLNPKSPYWAIYGGRGIKICDRWLEFDQFLNDMGDKPEGTSIDRIDVNGNYEPENCRWATTKEQGNNKRKKIFVEPIVALIRQMESGFVDYPTAIRELKLLISD